MTTKSKPNPLALLRNFCMWREATASVALSQPGIIEMNSHSRSLNKPEETNRMAKQKAKKAAAVKPAPKKAKTTKRTKK